MAQRTTVKLISDLNGEEIQAGEGQTVEFGLDGVTYESDLFNDQAEELREILAPYIAAGRRTGGRAKRGTGSTKPAGARMSREQSTAIRSWWRSRGGEIADRGRIPGHVVEEFEAAHQNAAA